MNLSPSPHLLSPLGISIVSPVSHESQGSASSFSGDQSSRSATTTDLSDHGSSLNKKKNIKTEYKSKFTPFDQYSYNELTDSFVKQSTDLHVSSSKSNQDLASLDLAHQNGQATATSCNTNELDTPNELIHGPDSHTNIEPWYKEVQKRNEKANEYRFKSEVGHNSPLLNYNSNNRADSPHIPEPRQINSPFGTESIGGDRVMSAGAASQNNDQPVDSSLDHRQQQYKFTPHDYKRDHLISYMAKNNNFAPTKEQQESSDKILSRRVQVSGASSGGRPATRSAAQIRSRSQSSRRQPASTASISLASKAPTAAKSNQTTPTRTLASRTGASTTRTHPAPAPTMTKSTMRTTARTTTKSTSAAPSNGLAPKPTQTAAQTRRVPLTGAKVAPKQTNGPTTQAGSGLATTKRVVPTGSASRTVARAPSKPTTGGGSTSASITPTTATSRQQAARSSAPGRTLSANNKQSKPSQKPPAPTAVTAIKSIKTPKAMAAQQAAMGAAAGAVALTSAAIIPDSIPTTNDESKTTDEVQNTDKVVVQEEHQLIQHERPFVNEEQNLIFTTTEAGNMLADELAQAEMEANSRNKSEQQQPDEQVHRRESIDLQSLIVNKCEISETSEPAPKTVDESELINGLANGMISAEDRFDSSDKEASLANIDSEKVANYDTFAAREHNCDDQPYSIMPTATTTPAFINHEDQTNSHVADVDVEKADEPSIKVVTDQQAIEKSNADEPDNDSGSSSGESDHTEESAEINSASETSSTVEVSKEVASTNDNPTKEATGDDTDVLLQNHTKEAPPPSSNDETLLKDLSNEIPSQNSNNVTIDGIKNDETVYLEALTDIVDSPKKLGDVDAISIDTNTEQVHPKVESAGEHDLLGPLDDNQESDEIKSHPNQESQHDNIEPEINKTGRESLDSASEDTLDSEENSPVVHVENMTANGPALTEEPEMFDYSRSSLTGNDLNEPAIETEQVKRGEQHGEVKFVDSPALESADTTFRGVELDMSINSDPLTRNEGIILNLMATEDRMGGTVELGDGSSAGIETATAAESLVELATSKVLVPEISQTNYTFSRRLTEESDEEVEVGNEQDPIGSAATMSANASISEGIKQFAVTKSPSLDGLPEQTCERLVSSVKSEISDGQDPISSAATINSSTSVSDDLVRFEAEEEHVSDDPQSETCDKQADSAKTDGGVDEKDPIAATASMISAACISDGLMRFETARDPTLDSQSDEKRVSFIKSELSDGATKVADSDGFTMIESVDITTNIIEDTVKQIQQHGELHRQLNISHQERRSSSNFD